MKIADHLKEWAKTLAGASIIFLLLKVTGLLGSVSYLTQSAALQTGLLNASNEPLQNRDPFNYDFVIKDLAGNKINFDQYRGKVVFINLWATWCGPCRAEMQGIQKLYDKVDHDKIQFVMLSIDKDKDLDKVTAYLKAKTFTFPAFMPSGYLAEQLRVPSIPTTFILSKDGTIAAKEVGTTNFNTAKFKKMIEQLAAE